jgi:hypothetical protein
VKHRVLQDADDPEKRRLPIEPLFRLDFLGADSVTSGGGLEERARADLRARRRRKTPTDVSLLTESIKERDK